MVQRTTPVAPKFGSEDANNDKPALAFLKSPFYPLNYLSYNFILGISLNMLTYIM